MNYIPESFDAENAKHTRAIDALKAFYKQEGTAKIKELPGLNNKRYDLEIFFTSHADDIYSVEMKTNRGTDVSGHRMYDTFLLETYADHEQNKPTDWRIAESLDYLIECNRSTMKAYVYHVPKLRKWVDSHIANQCPAGKGVGQRPGDTLCAWGIRIKWECKEAGWIKTIDLAPFWNGKDVS
jgi:hypothetical protein